MRLLLVSNGFPPQDLGGTEVHVAAVARRLAAAGHQVRILAGDPLGRLPRRSVVDESAGDVAVRRVGASWLAGPHSPLRDAWVRAEFERVLDEDRPDVVHVHHLLHLSGDLIEAAHSREIPAAVSLHDFWFQCPTIHPGPDVRHTPGALWGWDCVRHHELPFRRRMASDAISGRLPRVLGQTLRRPAFLRRQLAFAEALLAPSRFVRDAFAHFGVPDERLRIMPHGIELEPVRQERRASGPVRFGFVGSLVPVKGVDVLCEVFAGLDGRSTLDIHGPAPDAEFLHRIAGTFGPRIRYRGEFHPDDRAQVYASFDVLVLPSLVTETFGLSVAEARVCGLPVIASSIGALPEQLSHGRDGLLVPPGDRAALARALTRLQDPEEVARFARRTTKPRTMSSYMDELEDLYGGLLRGGRAAAATSEPAISRNGLAPRETVTEAGEPVPRETVTVAGEGSVHGETISVAMCTYNGAAFVEEQLRSIAAQSRVPDEMVVCDDGSVDGTVQVIEEFAASVPFPVRVSVNERRLGPARNFEGAISLCRGSLIALADQDDVWEPEKLALEEQRLLRGGFEAVFCDADVVGADLSPLGYRLWESVDFTGRDRERIATGAGVRLLLRKDVVTGATLLFRARNRDVILPVPDGWPHDAWIALVVAVRGGLGFVDRPLVRYRQHANNQIGATFTPPGLAQLAAARASARRDCGVFAGQLERYAAGSKRLAELTALHVETAVLADIAAKTEHARRRWELAGSKLRRLPIVARELASGRYHRYSQGWRSAGKDLLLRT